LRITPFTQMKMPTTTMAKVISSWRIS
jgi:hypothetical protein